jgi:hypothetical protein
MSKRITLSFLIGNAQVFLWALLSLLILAPTSSLYAQDSDDVDDVEEFFGDDEEYEDDEYEDDEYLDDDEYEDDEYEDDEYEDDEYEDDEDEFDESEDNEVLSDEAENLGYTIDLQGGSPRFVNKNIIDWGSNVDIRGSVEFPVLMQVLGMKFRFGAEIGTFNFTHTLPPGTDTYTGISAMGILAFPAGPGKIKIGTGIVGSSPGFIMEATYGIRIGGILDIRGGFRSTEVINATTKEDVGLGHTGWVDGIIVLGINL